MIQVKNGKNSRRLTVVLGAGFIICLMSVPGWGQYGGGSGTEGDPFLISDPCHMQAIGEHQEHWVAGTWFKLVEDIDMSRFTGTQYNIIGNETTKFDGYFDGNELKIHNFSYSTTSTESYVGLFGYLGSDGEIRDLGLEDPCIATAGNYVGGLVGWNQYGTISNCYARGMVTGGDYSEFLGVLVGFNRGAISNSYARGALTGGFMSWYLGSLVGGNSFGSISNCYATGSVSGGEYSVYVGGLSGWNWYGTISHSYATGAVIGGSNSRFLGGLVGGYGRGSISNCYWDEESSGLSYSHGGRKKATAAMKEEQTYVGWNDGSWVIDEGNDKPHLSWEEGAQDLPAITTDYPARTYPGNGTDHPFELDDPNDLVCMSLRTEDWDKKFILAGDIDMSLVTDYFPPSGFNGYINGRGYAVINLTVDANVIGNNCQLSLIGRLGNQGHLENLGVEEANIIGGDYSHFLGGLVGINRGAISNCYATGAVTDGSNSRYLGGLVGENYNTINNSYADGEVTGGDDSRCLGGLVGYNWNGTISNCYATGAISGDVWLGGLVGWDNNGTYTKSFWDETVNAGLSGIGNTSDPNVIAETTENMQKSGTFTSVGWDFVGSGDNEPNDFWRMCVDDLDYPKLSWQFADGDLLCPDGVGLLDLFYFVSHWLEIDCETANNYCRRADFNFSGRVDLVDYNIFRSNWQKK